jgi:hypothetical protein
MCGHKKLHVYDDVTSLNNFLIVRNYYGIQGRNKSNKMMEKNLN